LCSIVSVLADCHNHTYNRLATIGILTAAGFITRLGGHITGSWAGGARRGADTGMKLIICKEK